MKYYIYERISKVYPSTITFSMKKHYKRFVSLVEKASGMRKEYREIKNNIKHAQTPEEIVRLDKKIRPLMVREMKIIRKLIPNIAHLFINIKILRKNTLRYGNLPESAAAPLKEERRKMNTIMKDIQNREKSTFLNSITNLIKTSGTIGKIKSISDIKRINGMYSKIKKIKMKKEVSTEEIDDRIKDIQSEVISTKTEFRLKDKEAMKRAQEIVNEKIARMNKEIKVMQQKRNVILDKKLKIEAYNRQQKRKRDDNMNTLFNETNNLIEEMYIQLSYLMEICDEQFRMLKDHKSNLYRQFSNEVEELIALMDYHRKAVNSVLKKAKTQNVFI